MAINALPLEQVAAIVKQAHPRAMDAKVDELARQAIADAHRIVSRRKYARETQRPQALTCGLILLDTIIALGCQHLRSFH